MRKRHVSVQGTLTTGLRSTTGQLGQVNFGEERLMEKEKTTSFSTLVLQKPEGKSWPTAVAP